MVSFSRFAVTATFMVGGASAAMVSGYTSPTKVLTQAFLQNDMSLGELVDNHLESMSLADAMKASGPEIPKEVKLIVGEKKANVAAPKFTEKALTKARNILNGMVATAQDELDAKMIVCKAFQNKNRGTFDQVVADLARLGSQISNLEGIIGDSVNSISVAEGEMAVLDKAVDEAKIAYKTVKDADDAEMMIRQDDLAVAEFIMEITKCEKKALLIQKHGVSACESANAGGQMTFKFTDAELQAKIDSLKSQAARTAMQNALGLAVTGQRAFGSDVAHGQPALLDLGSAIERPTRAANKCSMSKPNCGLLHDNMSLMWGEMKDAVDSLQAKMDKEAAEHADLMENFGQQRATLAATKAQGAAQLAEATASKNADGEEQGEKQQEKIELEAEYKTVWGECVLTMDEILHTRICGVKKVRNEVANHSTATKALDLQDCEVSDFVPGECSSPCDEEQIGGMRQLKREIITNVNEFGIRCPKLTYQQKCNQIKCPVDCGQSRWSSWSACTKECGGGMQSRSRNIVTLPKNGGTPCADPSESRQCNVGSCDRDCTLKKFTKWTGCTQACDTGYTERFRHVKRPLRAFGKCPKSGGRARYAKRKCNKQLCRGDELCIAELDLVIAVDGSGSVKEKGFDVLKNFTGELVKRFRGKKYKVSKMKVGVLLFGNGEILEDKTIAPATIVSGMTDDLEGLQKPIADMKWQRGFTNMAQAFTQAGVLFLNGGRKEAQSQLLIITDAAPSFKFETSKMATTLKDTGAHLNIVAIRSSEGDEVEYMKELVSAPAETHMTYIPGLKALKMATEGYVSQVLVQNCPVAESPSEMAERSKEMGFKLVAENRDCPCWWLDLGKHDSAENCKIQARAKGAQNFVFGKGPMSYYGGQCFGNKKKDGKCECGWVDSTFDHYTLLGGEFSNEESSKKMMLTALEPSEAEIEAKGPAPRPTP